MTIGQSPCILDGPKEPGHPVEDLSQRLPGSQRGDLRRKSLKEPLRLKIHGSHCASAVKTSGHLTYTFMALNNYEVLIKMKADIGMKDPPNPPTHTLAVHNVQEVPLKGEHFLRRGAFILIAYRKRRVERAERGWGEARMGGGRLKKGNQTTFSGATASPSSHVRAANGQAASHTLTAGGS